jgi:hypothetical protein
MDSFVWPFFYLATQAFKDCDMAGKSDTALPPLESVNKPHLTTDELAHYSNLRPQTWRKKACYGTHPDGIKPIRICGRLAWPTEAVKRWLEVPV